MPGSSAAADGDRHEDSPNAPRATQPSPDDAEESWPTSPTPISEGMSHLHAPEEQSAAVAAREGVTMAETLRLGSIRQGDDHRRLDSSKYLSAVRASDADPHHQANLPLMLTAFIIILAALCGVIVTGVHYLVLYAGCPLGVNGCNEFHNKEKTGYFLIRWFDKISDGQMSEGMVHLLVSLVAALLFAGLVTRVPERTAFEIRGGGAMQSLVAVATGERILLRDAFVRLVATSLYLGSGGPLGGEGPAIQVCTAVTMAMGWACGIRSSVTQSLLASLGFVCGFAASFNAPVAGILFAMEELEHVSPSLEKSMICCILVASIVATVTLRILYGDTHLFQVPWPTYSSEGGLMVLGKDMWMLIAIPIGLVCSLIGALIVLSMRSLNRLWVRYVRLPYTVIFACQAVIVASVGIGVLRATGLRGIWGIGVGSLQHALSDGDKLQVWDYLIFCAGKILVMILAVTVRAPGDVLEPVLIIGGFAGGIIGRLLCYGMDLPNSEVMTPCIIFGMVGLFASCFRFPLTPIVIVGEITGVESYRIILPTALAGFTALTASSRLFRPILDEIMHEDGIDIHSLMEEVKEQEQLNRIISSASVAEDLSIAEEGGLYSVDLSAGERRPSRSLFNMEGMLQEFCTMHSPTSNSAVDLDSISRQHSGMSLSNVGVGEDAEDAHARRISVATDPISRSSKRSSIAEVDLRRLSRRSSSHQSHQSSGEGAENNKRHSHREGYRPRGRNDNFAGASSLNGGEHHGGGHCARQGNPRLGI